MKEETVKLQQAEIDRLKEETKDYAALIVRYHAEEARFLQMRHEAAALRVALLEAHSCLEQERYMTATDVIEKALNITPSL